MVNPSWGLKRLCQGCSAHFYDMRRRPAVCPKCATVFDLETLYKAKRGRNTDIKDDSAEVVKLFEEDIGTELDEEDNTDVADEILEDTSDLESESDIPEVVDHEDLEEDR